MSDKQAEQPEPRKIVAGDRVKMKGGEGPQMTVNRRHEASDIVCVWWSKDSSVFESQSFHADALEVVASSDTREELTAIGQVNSAGNLDFVGNGFQRLRPGELIYVKR